MSEKNAIALGSFAISLFAGPLASVAVGVGAAVTLGNIGIHVYNSRRKLELLQDQDPVHYLVEVERQSHA